MLVGLFLKTVVSTLGVTYSTFDDGADATIDQDTGIRVGFRLGAGVGSDVGGLGAGLGAGVGLDVGGLGDGRTVGHREGSRVGCRVGLNEGLPVNVTKSIFHDDRSKLWNMSGLELGAVVIISLGPVGGEVVSGEGGGARYVPVGINVACDTAVGSAESSALMVDDVVALSTEDDVVALSIEDTVASTKKVSLGGDVDDVASVSFEDATSPSTPSSFATGDDTTVISTESSALTVGDVFALSIEDAVVVSTKPISSGDDGDVASSWSPPLTAVSFKDLMSITSPSTSSSLPAGSSCWLEEDVEYSSTLIAGDNEGASDPLTPPPTPGD